MSVDFSKLKDWDYLEEVLVNNITESDNSIEILKAKVIILQILYILSMNLINTFNN